MKIAVAVSGIERSYGRSDQEIALSGVANALALRCVADAIHLVQRVRNVIRESGFIEGPLTIRLSEGWKPKEQETHENFYLFIHSPPFDSNQNLKDTETIAAP
jgi:hypothetical protein